MSALALALLLAAVPAAPTQAPTPHDVVLEMRFSEAMGGGGDMTAVLDFPSGSQCRDVRRKIWHKLKGADGFLGDCAPSSTRARDPRVTHGFSASADLDGGGAVTAEVGFTSAGLCRAVRRALAAVDEFSGALGECRPAGAK